MRRRLIDLDRFGILGNPLSVWVNSGYANAGFLQWVGFPPEEPGNSHRGRLFVPCPGGEQLRIELNRRKAEPRGGPGSIFAGV